MHIENEVKLDFKDVLIRPKRSTLSSRSNVDLIRPFTLRNSKVEYSGVPIIAANMDTTGTFEMADALGNMIFPLRCISTTPKTNTSPISMA